MMDIRLIGMFNAALVEDTKVEFETISKEALKRGFLVHPDVCNKSVLEYIKSQEIDYNATFYKDWEDVISKSRFELFIDQIIHYATTYGTDYQGEPYIPNDGAENVPSISFDKLKVIVPIEKEELFTRCMGMLQSGIAMKNDTLDAVCEFIINAGYTVDVDSIKNREALIRICDALLIYPTESINLFRYIIFKTTGDAMIIKNRTEVWKIQNSLNIFDLSKLNDVQLNSLSKIFYRFKPLFLAFKTLKANKSVVNKLRRLARKNHKPMKTPFWNDVLSKRYENVVIESHLSELTNFKKIALMQTIMEYLSDSEDRLYLVRNGKTYMKTSKTIDNAQRSYLMNLFVILKNNLVSSLKDKATYCKFPKNCELVCPTSEKNFIGNYPIGTQFALSDHNFIGVYWRGEWGTQDFDLSSIGLNGNKIGWNASYYNNDGSIIYSGDMTSANPDASEVLYCKGKFPSSIIRVNRYNGEEGSKFKLFLGVENNTKNKTSWMSNGCSHRNDGRGYMVDPNTIQFAVDMVSESRETTLGVVTEDGKFVLTDMKTGNSRVSYGANGSKMLGVMMHKLNCYVPIKDILVEAGFKDYDEDNVIESVDAVTGEATLVERPWEKDYIDFNNPTKDVLINLFK